jgi:rhodanese-related sulfurtransferase
MARRASFLAQAALLLGAAALLAAISNLVRPKERQLPWVRSYPDALKVPVEKSPAAAAQPASDGSAGAPDFSPHPASPWKEITSEQAKSLFDQGAIFIDARRTSVYREGHIARARPMPVWESDIDDRVKAFYAEGHEGNAPIVAYCSGGDCEDSHELAQKLWGAGFDAVFVYRDGYPDWEKRSWPVEKGDAK